MSEERNIIRAMQDGLPLCQNPYSVIAERLGMDEEELHTRINDMMARGVIRRIGLVPNHYRIGYRHNAMTVWALEDDKVDRIGELLGEQPFVSHCYRRPNFPPHWPFNLFAMVHGRDGHEVREKIESLRKLVGKDCLESDVLFSRRILKKSGLRLKDRRPDHAQAV